jgi:membrane associated rhomboid family serine protease
LKKRAAAGNFISMLDDRPYMRTPYRPGWSMTTILCVTLIGCFLAQLVLAGWKGDKWVLDYLALSAKGLEDWRIYQLITFQFLHGGIIHLLGNLIGIYFFGRAVESILGGKEMLKLYLISGTAGGLLQVALQLVLRQINHDYPVSGVLGASAGVFGLIAAFAIHAPDNPITMLVFFVLPVTFPAKVLLIGEAAFSVLGVLAPFLHSSWLADNLATVAHGAHLGGMLTGIAWMRWAMTPHRSFEFWRPFSARRTSRRDAAGPSAKRASRKSVKKVEELPAGEFISQEVDPILEKISAHGIHSLTERERQILEAARSKMARR